MIKKVLLLLALAFCFHSKAQQHVSIGLTGEYSENFRFRNYAGGIQFEIPLDNFSLHYKAVIGSSTNRDLYVHAPIGAAVGSVILHYIGQADIKAINVLGALLFAIPEGITYYPNPDAKIRTGIYVAPLGCDYWRKKREYEHFRLSGEIGARIKFPIANEQGDIFLQGGIRSLYNNKKVDPFFIHAGAGVALNFK